MEPIVNMLSVVAVRTPTLPPATHTNAWVYGADALTVIDPASPYEDERSRLFAALLEEIARGRTIRRLFLTHHHADHVSGAADLQRRLLEAGHPVPIAAHPATAALVRDRMEVSELVTDGQDVDGLIALHTPGHAPGHLVLHHPDGWVIAGDLVAGVGTIVIDPEEGDLQQYLDSLERVRKLGVERLMPAHGPVLPHADAVLSFYVAHRHQRTQQIREALDRAGQATPAQLVPAVYPELSPLMHPVAAAQIRTHLMWLARHGLSVPHEGGVWARA
jgi:ribonuclease/clavin/mitogillin